MLQNNERKSSGYESIEEDDLQLVESFQNICNDKKDLIDKNRSLKEQNSKLVELIVDACNKIHETSLTEKENLNISSINLLKKEVPNLTASPAKALTPNSKPKHFALFAKLKKFEMENKTLKKSLRTFKQDQNVKS